MISLFVIIILNPFLHNHSPDFKYHQYCPVFLLQFSVFGIILYILISIMLVLISIRIFKKSIDKTLFPAYFSYLNKAPPLA